jgi:hypothetical protein
MRFSFFMCLLLSFAFSCRSVQSVSLTQIPAQRDKVVKAEVSKFIFLGLNFNNDFVDGLVDQLKEECKGGQVKGILTKDEVVNYFLMIFYTRQISAQGYCISGNGKGKLSSLELEPAL